MATFLLTWNPLKWDWASLDEVTNQFGDNGFIEISWSCGITKRIIVGDKIFLIKIGRKQPKGIMASGVVIASPYLKPHYSIPGKYATNIDVKIDWIINPEKNRLLELDLIKREFPNFGWTPQNSGIKIPEQYIEKLESIWALHKTSNNKC